MLLTAHLLHLAVGLPALVVVVYALFKKTDDLPPLVWLLAILLAAAPLATGYLWLRSPIFALGYGLLTYAAAIGFAVRLVHRHLQFRYHGPLMILFITSATTAFTTFAMFVPPAIHDMTVMEDASQPNADEDIRQALVDVNTSLDRLKLEQLNVERGVQRVMLEMRVRESNIRRLEVQRDQVAEEVRSLSRLKALTPEQVAELRRILDSRSNTQNLLGFVIGVASSITAALALKFFLSSD